MEKYLQYTAEEFATDESFINWVKKLDKNHSVFWDNWLRENPNKKPLIDKAIAIVQNLRFRSETIPTGTQKNIWQAIEKELDQTEVTNKARPLFRRSFALGFAASLLGAFIYFGFFGKGMIEVQTSYADLQSISLPDNSSIEINADSRISYDKKEWKNNREVHLEGEGFFEVEKGSSFVVKTDLGQVEVLGTSFNVMSRNNQLTVHCETGRVLVKYQGQETILNPNQNVSIVNGRKQDANEDNNLVDRGSWRKGLYKYDNVSLSDVIRDVERHWGVQVELPANIADEKFKGSYKSENLEKALAEIFWPFGLKYSIQDKNITITQ